MIDLFTNKGRRPALRGVALGTGRPCETRLSRLGGGRSDQDLSVSVPEAVELRALFAPLPLVLTWILWAFDDWSCLGSAIFSTPFAKFAWILSGSGSNGNWMARWKLP